MKKVITCQFDAHREEIRLVRWQVFVHELGIPEELEFGDDETHYLHVLAYVDDEAVATGRIAPSGQIGRVAVLKGFRRAGFGRRVMRCLENAAREEGLSEVYLAAQIDSIPFYLAQGYLSEGETYLEVGIPHQQMRKNVLAFKDEVSP